MNERIKELWERACTRYSVYETLKPQDERKIIPDIFAELIVRECCLQVADVRIENDFEPVGDAALVQALTGIRRYFGVEE
jgi:hypothetical protein